MALSKKELLELAKPSIIEEFANSWDDIVDVLLYGRWYLKMVNKKTKKHGLIAIRVYLPTKFAEATAKEIDELKRAAGTLYTSKFFAETEVLDSGKFRVSPRLIV